MRTWVVSECDGECAIVWQLCGECVSVRWVCGECVVSMLVYGEYCIWVYEGGGEYVTSVYVVSVCVCSE